MNIFVVVQVLHGAAAGVGAPAAAAQVVGVVPVAVVVGLHAVDPVVEGGKQVGLGLRRVIEASHHTLEQLLSGSAVQFGKVAAVAIVQFGQPAAADFRTDALAFGVVVLGVAPDAMQNVECRM